MIRAIPWQPTQAASQRSLDRALTAFLDAEGITFPGLLRDRSSQARVVRGFACKATRLFGGPDLFIPR
jgi:hypothetical protein